MIVRMHTKLAMLVAIGSMLGGCEWLESKRPELTFAPYDKSYASKPDFARVEYRYPLTRSQRARLAPEHLAALDQEQIDQIYARLTAGPIPDGPFDGTILLPRGASGKLRIAEIAGGFTELALHLKGLEIESLGEAIWKGKVFYRNEGVLRNRIQNLDVLKTIGLVEPEPRKHAVEDKETWLLFPAKLYCGQSLLDARRESIIIDYFFSDEIAGYQEKPDFLAGRRGLRVRDEIRMVRPGFYLGRAYLDRGFLLNFTLYNDEIARRDVDAFASSSPLQEDCYTGTQQPFAKAIAKQPARTE
ncbi:MAG TPA: hypothetical protein VGL25_02425 [Casimicrobiaceae bacterium]